MHSAKYADNMPTSCRNKMVLPPKLTLFLPGWNFGCPGGSTRSVSIGLKSFRRKNCTSIKGLPSWHADMLLLVPLRAVSFANAKQNAVLVRCNYYKTDPSFLSWLIQDQTIALEKHGIGLPTMQKVVRHTRSGNFCCRRLNISRLSGNRKRLAFRVGGLKARGRHRQGGLPEHKFLSVRARYWQSRQWQFL